LPFLAPLLLFGAIFASAPIIIHLLNRRQFKLVEWAPMKYLKLTLRTNRRRLQLEQWVLLLIRTLVILLLIFAVARPFFSGNAAASWLSLGGRTSRVILIDDSLSMGLQMDGKTAFERATDQAATLIESIGSQDALTVATTSSLNQPMLRDSVQTTEEAATLAQQVRGLEVTESGNNWAVTLGRLADMLEGAKHNSKEVRIFTDQRASGWSADAAEQAARLEAMGVKVVIVRIGQPSPGNAALVELEQATNIALANTPVRLVARIDTDGDPQFEEEYATLIIDGQESLIELPDIGAGQRGIELKIDHTFELPGQHTIELRLPNDAMLGDNSRSRVIDVAESVRILLVDGDPGQQSRTSEVYNIGHILNSSRMPIQTTVMAFDEWFERPTVGSYDLVVMANVSLFDIPSNRIQQLTNLVESGMGLVIYTGDLVDPGTYNDLLYVNGEGLLPAMLQESEPVDVQGLIIEQLDDTPLQLLANGQINHPQLLTTAAPRQIMPVVLPNLTERNDVRVLARWNGLDQPPAAIERRLGKGSVILWTVSADRAWSDWPLEASYVASVYDMVLSIAGVPQSAGNLTAGQTIRQNVSASNPPLRADMLVPGSEKVTAATIVADIDRPQITFEDTHQAGLYRLAWDMSGREEDLSEVFALSPDVRESDLKQLTDEELAQMLPGVDLQMIDLTDPGSGAAQQEIWRTLAMLLLGFVVVESAFAAWVGREH